MSHQGFIEPFFQRRPVPQSGMRVGDAHWDPREPGCQHTPAGIEHGVCVNSRIRVFFHLPHQLADKAAVALRRSRQMNNFASVIQQNLFVLSDLITENDIMYFVFGRIRIQADVSGHFFRAADCQQSGDL